MDSETAPDGGPPLQALPLSKGRTAWTGGPFRLLDTVITARSEDEVLGDFAEQLLSSFAASSGTAESRRLEIHRWRDSLACYLDGERVLCGPDRRSMARSLLWYLNVLGSQSAGGDVLLHAAVASLDGQAVLLPGRPGAGKTTLVTALVLDGWQYLSDELAVVALNSDLVRAYPRPIALEPDAGRLLPPLPRRWAPGTDLIDDLQVVVPSWVRPDAVAPSARPAAIVFPQVRPGTVATLTRRSRADALVQLLEHVVSPRDAATFGRLARLVRGCRTGTLELDGTAHAPDVLRPLVHSA